MKQSKRLNADENLKTLEMKRLFEEEGLTMKEIGERYGIIKQAVQNRLGKIGVGRRPNKYTLLDKEKLVKYYSDESLSIEKIAKQMGESKRTIEIALVYYGIPRRKSVKFGGKHVDLLRKLQIGEQIEITFEGKSPHAVLHRAAQAIGMKISVRCQGSEKFRVTRKE